MANRDTPMGLRALRDRNGSHPPVKTYDATTSVIFEGQLVLISSTGLVAGHPAAGIATTSKKIVGVASHPKALTTTAQIAAGNSKVKVYIDPNQQYLVQSDDASLDSLTDYVGRNFKVILPAGGNTTTGQSTMELDGSTGTSAEVASSSSMILNVVEKHNRPDNVVTTGGTASSNADFVVRINPRWHFFANSTGV